jgi:hypothetical protein
LFDKSKGIDDSIHGSSLVIGKEEGVRIQMDENGSLLSSLLLEERGGAADATVLDSQPLFKRASCMSWGFCCRSVDVGQDRSTQCFSHVILAPSIETSDHMF